MRNEYVVKKEYYEASGDKPEACHLVEARRLRSKPDQNHDMCNRIILPKTLHDLFDQDRPEVRFAYEGDIDQFAEADHRTRQQTYETAATHYIQLVASFCTVRRATYYAAIMRGAEHTTDTNVVTFHIDHPFPRAFIEYLTRRDVTQCRTMFLSLCDGDETEDEDDVNHEHKRAQHVQIPTVPWICDCHGTDHTSVRMR